MSHLEGFSLLKIVPMLSPKQVELQYNYNVENAEATEKALEAMRYLPPMEDSVVYPGIFDCFKWITEKSDLDPFSVKPASMYNIRASYYSEEEEMAHWENLPQWYLQLADADPQTAHDQWKSAILPMNWQFYLISAQKILILETNNLDDLLFDENGAPLYFTSRNPFFEAFKRYIGYNYETMNYVLRGLPKYETEVCRDASHVENLLLLQWMITLMPAVEVHHLTYRYCQMIPSLEEARDGDVLSFKGYTSVTMNILKTINIVNWQGEMKPDKSRMVMMQLHIPPGSRFLIVPSGENEIILPHYCQFRLKLKKQATDFITFMSLELVNDPTMCSRIENGIS